MDTNKQPSYHILICLIQIWTPKDLNNLLEVPSDAMVISECKEIEIEESYRKLIGTASVKLPRGTVVRKTITPKNLEDVKKDSRLSASLDAAGVVEEVRKEVAEIAKVDNFKIGQRIRIHLGYTTDPEVAAMAKTNNFNKSSSIYMDPNNLKKYLAEKSLHQMFDGYITQISVDTPIELHCENLASVLKQITCPHIVINSNATVNDFLSDKGKYKMLKGTGLTLHPETASQVFDLGKVDIAPDLTVADVVTHWSKYGISGFVSEYNGKPTLCIGRSYFHKARKDSIISAQTQPAKPIDILFDYHVAKNGLSFTRTDKKFLAVEAEGLATDGKFYHITVLRNPKYNPNDKSTGSPYRALNETKLSKKAMKLGLRPISNSSEKLNTKLYTKIPYHSRKIPIKRDELYAEAIKYLESYNMNGIDGTLTLFGDLHLQTATQVRLIDNRFPGKNGYYLVDTVHTTFGTGGYRQNIKLPYCIKRDNGVVDQRKVTKAMTKPAYTNIAVQTKKDARGLRNNNPCNIRRGSDNWQGLRDTQTDKEFCQFTSMTYGYRAAFATVKTYTQEHGLATIEEIITRWAPPSENDTAAYIKTVCKRMGNVSPSFQIASTHKANMCNLIAAMSYVENGITANMTEVYGGYEIL